MQKPCTPPHRQRAKLQFGVALEPSLVNQSLHIVIRRQPLPTECRREALPVVVASRATQCAMFMRHVPARRAPAKARFGRGGPSAECGKAQAQPASVRTTAGLAPGRLAKMCEQRCAVLMPVWWASVGTWCRRCPCVVRRVVSLLFHFCCFTVSLWGTYHGW